MKMISTILAVAASVASAAFGYVAIDAGASGTPVVSPAKVVAIECVSTNLTGTATVKVVKSVSLEWSEQTVTMSTNVTYRSVAVDGFRTNVTENLFVSDGFRNVSVNSPIGVTTNLVGTGTNVITVTSGATSIYCATNATPYTWTVSTNLWFSPTRTWVSSALTNVTPVVSVTQMAKRIAVTNTIGSVSCSGGYGIATNISAFIKNGDVIIGSGTAVDGGKVTVIAE